MKLSLVSPCGGSYEELAASVRSVNLVAKQLPEVQFEHWLVFNNQADPGRIPVQDLAYNYELVVEDINPVACRAEARNHALSKIVAESNTYVIFLDSGDLLCPDMITELYLGKVRCDKPLAGKSVILGEDFSSMRPPIPLWVKYLVNPFYLGSVIQEAKTAKLVKFHPGNKEDWKYWLEILQIVGSVYRSPAISYIYTVKNVKNHTSRKSRIFKKQFSLYRDYLKMSLLRTILFFVVYYFLHVFIWYVCVPVMSRIRRKEIAGALDSVGINL